MNINIIAMIALISTVTFAQFEEPAPADYWTPKYTTCKENLNDAIHNCTGLMGNAAALQAQILGQLSTMESERNFYRNRLDEASEWYNQVSIMIPLTALVTLVLSLIVPILWRQL